MVPTGVRPDATQSNNAVALIRQADPERPGVAACELGLAPENLDEYRTRIDRNAKRFDRITHQVELERSGLAERRLSPRDRRARIVSVTAAGKRKVAEAEKVKERVQAEVLGELSTREGAALMDGLQKLVEGRLAEQVECSPPLRRREPRA